MRLEFLRLPHDERWLYIEQVAVRKNVLPVIVEKDFWVSWTLAVLFASSFSDALVFKGGTSLSKVFSVIDRANRTLVRADLRKAFIRLFRFPEPNAYFYCIR